MTKFVITYHASKEAILEMKKSSPEAMKEGMKPWMEWKEGLGASLVDMGMPFTGLGQKVDQSGSKDYDNDLVGFSIIQAASREEALSLVEKHPHIGWHEGAYLVVHETMTMPS